MVTPQQQQQPIEEEKYDNVPMTTATASTKNIPEVAVTIWWDLCYDGIINTIQRLVYQSFPPSGLALVSLLLDLLDYLLFVEWRKNTSPLNPKQVLVSGHWNNKNNKNNTGTTSTNYAQPRQAASTAIPRYYLTVIAIFQQIGRTVGGMKVLRTRVKDIHDHDRMGNALDVSIRHFHSLSWHWENHKVLHGAVLRLDDNDNNNNNNNNDQCDLCQRKRNELVDAVESWIRLWHQVLLFVQHCPGQEISFRSLVLELQPQYTSACAMLLSSEDTRPEIQTMLRWHLEELAFDEEEFLETQEEQKKKDPSPAK